LTTIIGVESTVPLETLVNNISSCERIHTLRRRNKVNPANSIKVVDAPDPLLGISVPTAM
jgi:hypothetical protein